MKIIEENIDHTIADIDTNIGKGKYSYLRESTRLDSKVFIALSIVEDIAKTLNAELIKLTWTQRALLLSGLCKISSGARWGSFSLQGRL